MASTGRVVKVRFLGDISQLEGPAETGLKESYAKAVDDLAEWPIELRVATGLAATQGEVGKLIFGDFLGDCRRRRIAEGSKGLPDPD